MIGERRGCGVDVGDDGIAVDVNVEVLLGRICSVAVGGITCGVEQEARITKTSSDSMRRML